jgi:hypothetical protein
MHGTLVIRNATSFGQAPLYPRVSTRCVARKVFAFPTRGLGGYFKLPQGARQVVGMVEDEKYTANLAESPQLAVLLPSCNIPPAAPGWWCGPAATRNWRRP